MRSLNDITELKELNWALKCNCNAYFRPFQLIGDEVVIPGAELNLSVKACSSMELSGETNWIDNGNYDFHFSENVQCFYKISQRLF